MRIPANRKALGNERGQMLILFILVMTVVFLIGAIVVDFGLWFSERRGAQKDSDLSAIAAAQDLLALTSFSSPAAGALQQQANDRATEYVQRNGVTDLANVHLPQPGDEAAWTGCWSDQGDTSDTMDSYPLDVEHPSKALFASIWGLAAPKDLGAHARACVGSIVAMKGIMPVGLPINSPDLNKFSRTLCWTPDNDGDGLPEPMFGTRCDLSVFDKVSGEASWLDLDNTSPLPKPPTVDCYNAGGGANELTDEIKAGGANTWCRVAPQGYTSAQCASASIPPVNWCVKSKTGGQANKIMDAFNSLFSTEGQCDSNGDGIDDFTTSIELVSGTPGTESAFYREICHSPRLITLIVVDNFDATGNSFMPIRAFAAFFVEACTIIDNNNVTTEYPKCDPPPGTPIGQAMFTGRFVNILGEGAVGAPTDWSPKRIVLDQ